MTTVTYTFVDGTVAEATEVNTNFTDITTPLTAVEDVTGDSIATTFALVGLY